MSLTNHISVVIQKSIMVGTPKQLVLVFRKSQGGVWTGGVYLESVCMFFSIEVRIK